VGLDLVLGDGIGHGVVLVELGLDGFAKIGERGGLPSDRECFLLGEGLLEDVLLELEDVLGRAARTRCSAYFW
jgi:hypothetical protein